MTCLIVYPFPLRSSVLACNTCCLSLGYSGPHGMLTVLTGGDASGVAAHAGAHACGVGGASVFTHHISIFLSTSCIAATVCGHIRPSIAIALPQASLSIA